MLCNAGRRMQYTYMNIWQRDEDREMLSRGMGRCRGSTFEIGKALQQLLLQEGVVVLKCFKDEYDRSTIVQSETTTDL